MTFLKSVCEFRRLQGLANTGNEKSAFRQVDVLVVPKSVGTLFSGTD